MEIQVFVFFAILFQLVVAKSPLCPVTSILYRVTAEGVVTADK